jgi:hypothetical protein
MALQDISSYINYPLQENLDAADTSDNFVMAIEKFDATVHTTVQKESILSGMFQWKPLIGTDTMSNAAMGDPILQAVTPGKEPEGKTIETGKMIVQVKTPIIARVTEPMLAAVQDHLDIKGRTPANFGKKIGKHEDEVLFVQTVKSILYEHETIVPIHPPTDGTTVSNKGTGGILIQGTTVTLNSGGDETDADKMDTAVTSLHQQLAEADLDPMSDGYLYMAPEQYFTLLKSDKLINVDYSSGNGNYAGAMVSRVSGLPIKMTNRMSQTQNDSDTGSTTTNGDSIYELYGSAYATSEEEANIVAQYISSQTIMVAASIPLTTKVYWDDRLLCWFIDSYEAFGAAPDRTDLCGGIFKA